MRTLKKTEKCYLAAALVLALSAVAWLVFSAPSSEAAQEPGTPEELSQFEESAPRIDAGPCWGRVHNPHNSSSQNPGPQWVQAKTNMYCNDLLSNIGTLRVRQSLYYRPNDQHSWSRMASVNTECNAATVDDSTNGWVQCHTDAEDFHSVMLSGVKAICIADTRYDYLQSSTALLTTDAGRRYAGAASKIGYDVLCRGQ